MHMISNIFDFEKTKFTLREQVQNPGKVKKLFPHGSGRSGF